MVQTAVGLLIFNRPEATEKVFAAIAKAMPRKLFIVADGPRKGVDGDSKKCERARAIAERVDWECDVAKNYAEENLGCGLRPATGITWVFEHVEEAIILEDDCVPHPTFFRYCDELLERYRNDERVMVISGRNNLGKRNTPHSYYFSRLMGCWGWATWRRAWRYFDIEIKLWPALRETPWLLNILGDPRAVEYWRTLFDEGYANINNVSYWDHQWSFACWAQHGLAAVPKINLVQNIGFGQNATHTKGPDDERAGVAVGKMIFPLQHPPYVVWDREADELRLKRILSGNRRSSDLPGWLRANLFNNYSDRIRKAISHFRAISCRVGGK